MNLATTTGVAVDLFVGANNSTFTNAAFIHGAGTLTKVGNGNMTLTSGNNNWTGGLGMNGGSVSISTFNVVHTASEPFFFNGGAFVWTGASINSGNTNYPYTFSSGGGTIDIPTAGVTFGRWDSADTGSGTLTLAGPGQFWPFNGGGGWPGGINVTNGSLLQDTSSLAKITGISVSGAGQYELFNDTAGTTTYSLAAGAVITLSGTGTAGFGGALLCLSKSNGFLSIVPSAITLASTSSIVVGEYTTTPSTLSLTGNISGPGGLIKDYLAVLPNSGRFFNEFASFTKFPGNPGPRRDEYLPWNHGDQFRNDLPTVQFGLARHDRSDHQYQ